MIPFVKRNPVRFPSKELLAEPPGLIDDKLFGDYDCKQLVSEKDCHIPSHSMGDILANPSDSSGSSYHTALCSEGTDSFKDCVESFEDDIDRLLTSSPANDLVPASPSELSSAAVKYFLASPSDNKAEQLSERPGLSDKASRPWPDQCSKGDDHTSAAASTAGTHSISCGSQASGAFLAVTAKRPQSQANSMHAPSHQVCRDQGCYSDKENQQVQMSVTAKNSSAPVYSVRMGLVTRELQPGDTGSKYLDHPLPFNSQRSGGMFLCARQMKKPSRVPVSSKPACPQYCAEFSSAVSDSDEADNEVQKLTALSFRSLSCPHGSYLDMYSSSNRTSSSLSNSLSEDSNGVNRWSTCHDLRKAEVLNPAKGNRQFPTVSQAPEKDQLNNTCRKEQFECIDVVLDNADSRQSHFKKRTVPKRQIQLKQKDRKDMNFLARGESTAQQGFLPLRNESCTKGRIISDEFRINYKQFMRTASLNDSYSKTQMASCLVKNVLAKKMQYEQKIKMEQKSMQGSSTSSAPSSVSTDLMGDFMEQKSSSLSKSDCSYSGEDMQSHSTSEKSESVAMSQDSMDVLRPTKGVVLNKQLRENVCKLKKTFNELNERMKYQDVLQSKRLPILADGVNEGSKNNKKQIAGKRKEYQKARALFESQQADPKGVDTTPSFSKIQKPWPNLKQRAIKPNKQMSWKKEKSPFEPESLAVPSKTSRTTFTSKTQEMKLMPQAKNEEKTPTTSRHLTPDGSSEGKVPAAVHSIKQSSLILPTSGKPCDDGKTSCPEASHVEETKETRSKGKGRIHQPRDVRKLVKNTYSLCFKSSDISQIVQYPCEETNSEGLATKEPTAASPLFIHCTSIQRKDATPTMNQSHGKDSDVSVHSMQDQGARENLYGTSLNPTIKPRMSMPVKVIESKGVVAAKSPMHITKIQSKKKVVAGNEEPQQKTENKPVPYEKSELNVTHSSAATRKPPQKESQLNIKVKSSLSKQPHRTEAPSYSAVEGKAVKDFSSQANFSILEDSKDSTSERTLPPSACPKEETKRPRDSHINTTIPGHLLEAYRSKKPHLSLQTHSSNEIISLTPLDSKDLSANPEEKGKVSELEPTNESHRYLQPVKPTVTSALQSYANTPIKNNFVNNALHQETESKILDALKPPGSQVFVPEYGMSPGSANTNTLYRSREYNEETRPPSSPSAEPLPPSGKLQDSRDHLSKLQATTEQYFTAAQAENANYLAIPTKGQMSEPAPTPSGVSNPDIASFSSNVSFQPGGEASASKMSNEPSQPKAPEGKADTDHSKSSPPSHVHPYPRHDESPNFMRRSDSSFPCGKSAASPTRPFAPHSHVHRKMLVDPDSGKCYYMEPPRQPQLKMLYDPETGQYIEVLIPPVPLASHSGLYQSPFNPLVMNPGVYGPSYMPYSGFPAFPLPPPPVAMPPTYPDLQNQQPAQESTNFNGTFSHVPKSEAPPPTQASDCSYMESLYYIPTGMNASPNPNQPLFSPATSSSPSVPEKGSMLRM
ncbi:uncharacterized protein C4orf54 [Alligator mississippiensis]|nr:uncharacterized protein C4orf54 [Alligator mississippiensis]